MPGMSFIRKYRMALEMAGSPPQPFSADIEVSLGVFPVAPVRQYGPSQNGASYCQILGGFRDCFFWDPPMLLNLQGPPERTERGNLALQVCCLTHDLDRKQGNAPYMFLLPHKLFTP